MQFQYKHQVFQQDAVNAVVGMFHGVDFSAVQPAPKLFTPQAETYRAEDLLERHHNEIERNLKEIQRRNKIKISAALNVDEYLALDTHMETGTGKTFTFINTIFELHKQYALTHFVIIVPSIAIKEGIKKSFATTKKHFENLYHRSVAVRELTPGKSAKKRKSVSAGVLNFIHARQLTALITTNHAFNRADNIINKELEGFYADAARTPMAAIAAKNPVLIIDEPQRVEGPKTAERIKDFKPLFVLRYSATFPEYKNLIYALDSYDAFAQRLVKTISVTDYGKGATAANSIFAEKISTRSGKSPSVTLAVADSAGGVKKINLAARADRDAIFKHTKNPLYRNLSVQKIDNRAQKVTLSDGRELTVGAMSGNDAANDLAITEEMLRDTIRKHLEKERDLFARGIKCISLIFIDRVKDYRDYDAADNRGELQKIFERCYAKICQEFMRDNVTDAYREYLTQWRPHETHGGYFSGDTNRNRKLDAAQKIGNSEHERKLQQEISELILRDKERVLQPDNKLRFIFAHSALSEGWDNPNVFQICKLRSGYSPTKMVQEVGRGLRICVNQELLRQDAEVLGGEFFAVNTLDIFTLGNGEFIKNLQDRLSARRSDAKTQVFKIGTDALIENFNVTFKRAIDLLQKLLAAGCINEDGYVINTAGVKEILIADELNPKFLLNKLVAAPEILDARAAGNKPRQYKASETHYKKFKELWKLLHQNVIYRVRYSPDFVANAVVAINKLPELPPIYLYRSRGEIETAEGEFVGEARSMSLREPVTLRCNLSARAFLNQIAEKTALPRNRVVEIIARLTADKYKNLQSNPFAAVQQVGKAINGVIYENIVDNVRYEKLDGMRAPQVTLSDQKFTALRYIELHELKEYKDNNLWEEIAPYDSVDPEKKISEAALSDAKISVFAKLPRAVKIPAPLYPQGINPDFAIVLNRANGDRQIYFIAEAKPTTATQELRGEEQRRVAFMQKYFDGLDAPIKFEVVGSYEDLLKLFPKPAKQSA